METVTIWNGTYMKKNLFKKLNKNLITPITRLYFSTQSTVNCKSVPLVFSLLLQQPSTTHNYHYKF